MADVLIDGIVRFVNDDRGLSETDKALEKLGVTSDRTRSNILALNQGYQIATDVLGRMAEGARLAYEAIDEGAQLQSTQDKFANLTASIGETTGLLDEMTAATKGTVSQFELMETANELIGLGMAKTGDEAIRLSRLSGQLGWDMQTLTLTLANDSKARLDSLGLSMEDVAEREERLIANGAALDKAFDLAVIEAGEAKLALLGDTSETTAGKLDVAAANIKDLSDQAKIGAAEGLTPLVESVADLTSSLNELSGGGNFFADFFGGAATPLVDMTDGLNSLLSIAGKVVQSQRDSGDAAAEAKREFDAWRQDIMEVDEGMGSLFGTIERTGIAIDEAAGSTSRYTSLVNENGEQINSLGEVVTHYNAELSQLYLNQLKQNNLTETATSYYEDEYYALADVNDVTSELVDSTGDLVDTASTLVDEFGNAIPTIEDYHQAIDQAARQTGDFFVDAINNAERGMGVFVATWNGAELSEAGVAQAIADVGREAGLSAAQLTLISPAFLEMSAAQQEAVVKMVIFQAKLEELKEILSSGAPDAVYQFRDAALAAADEINNMDLSGAKSELYGLEEQLANVSGEYTATVRINTVGNLPHIDPNDVGQPTPRASGGPVMPNRAYIVGDSPSGNLNEGHPELLVSGTSGHVYSNADLRSALGGESGSTSTDNSTINIYMAGRSKSSPHQVALAVRQANRRATKARYG